MKKHLLHFLSLTTFSLGLSSQLNAQSIIQSNTVPIAGDTLIVIRVDTAGIKPGPGGVNVTWSFPVLSKTDSIVSIYKLPAETPYANQYPEANLSQFIVASNTYQYYHTSGTALEILGFAGPSLTMVNSNTDISTKFPFTYMDSFIDTSYGLGTTSTGLKMRHRAIRSTTVDGYGTIVLPTGTFDNVLRFQVETNSLDSVFNATQTSYLTKVTSYTKENFWVSQDYRTYLFYFEEKEIVNGSNKPLKVQYSKITKPAIVTSVQNNQRAENILFFPNPWNSSTATLSLPEPLKNGQLSVFDVLGNEVHKLTDLNTSSIELVKDHFSDGLYFYQLTSNTHVVKTGKFIVR